MSKFMNLDARITIESVRSRKCDVKFNIISIIKNILFFLFVSGSKFLHFPFSLKMCFSSHIKDGSNTLFWVTMVLLNFKFTYYMTFTCILYTNRVIAVAEYKFYIS